MIPLIENRQARRLFLHLQGLSSSPSRKMLSQDWLDLIERMGFVQIDSINTVERAHHMILFSRNQTYKRKHLARLLEQDRTLFENWTHDASIIPTRFYPYWRLRFARDEAGLRERWRKWRREGFEEVLDGVLDHIRREGPAMSRELLAQESSRKGKGGNGWWDWHPSKTALEYLWRTGALAVDRREGFQKVYDLSERVIPVSHREAEPTPAAFIDWACQSALDRLGFATSGELAAFWGIAVAAETKTWCLDHLGNDLIEVMIESADGSSPRRVFARPDILESIEASPAPPSRLRVLSPFDPVLRDRSRTHRLFNFHYRIEVFVPAAKRQYGYYVFPLLEKDDLIGRIDMKYLRQSGVLSVKDFWLEPGRKMTTGRRRNLDAELNRICHFVGGERVEFEA